MGSKLRDFMEDIAAGKIPEELKDSRFKMPALEKLEQLLSNNQDHAWIEKICQEIESQSKPETAQEKQSRALLSVVQQFGGVIPVCNGKATIAFDVPSELLDVMISKGYLEECAEGYKVTDEGARRT